MSYQALLFCPDERTAQAVSKVLSDLDFTVAACSEPFAAVKRITTERFDALVVDCNHEQNAVLLFKSARNSESNHSSLAVALVEGQAGIAKAFRIGANLVLSKPINVEQSKATLRVARGLLRKAEAAKPAASRPKADVDAPAVTADLDSQPLPESLSPASDFPFTLSPTNLMLPGPGVAAGLEIEAKDELGPALGAAEAALLESLPDAITALPADIAGGSNAAASMFAQPSVPESVVAQTAESGNGAGSPAAAAARAKEIPSPVADLFEKPAVALNTPSPASSLPETKIAAKGAALRRSNTPPPDPHISAAPDAPVEGPGKKNFLIAAVLVLGLAVAGYFAWPVLQPYIMNLGVVKKYLAPPSEPTANSAPAHASSSAATAPAPVAAPDASAATPAPGSPSAATPSEQPAATQDAGPAGSRTPATSSAAPAASPSAEPSTQAEPATQPSASHPASPARPSPVVVKSDVKKKSPSSQVTPPPVLDVAPDSGEKAIAGIASGASPSAKPVLQVIRVSQGVSNGLLVKRVQPVYPPLALQMRVEGPVELEATVDKDGSTTDIKVLKGDPMLSHAAVDAVRHWKYKPYLLDGQPVQLQTQITINFKLPI